MTLEEIVKRVMEKSVKEAAVIEGAAVVAEHNRAKPTTIVTPVLISRTRPPHRAELEWMLTESGSEFVLAAGSGDEWFEVFDNTGKRKAEGALVSVATGDDIVLKFNALHVNSREERDYVYRAEGKVTTDGHLVLFGGKSAGIPHPPDSERLVMLDARSGHALRFGRLDALCMVESEHAGGAFVAGGDETFDLGAVRWSLHVDASSLVNSLSRQSGSSSEDIRRRLEFLVLSGLERSISEFVRWALSRHHDLPSARS